MRRSWMVPAVWAGAPVLYVVLVGWLMLNGYLDFAVVLVVMAALTLLGLSVWRWRAGHRRWAAVLALLGLAVWRWRAGHKRWAAVLVAGAVAIVAATGGYAYSLNQKIDLIPRVDDDVLGTNEDQRPPKEPTKAVNILLMGADNPQRLVEKPTVAELLEDGEWDPGAYRSDTMVLVHIPADR